MQNFREMTKQSIASTSSCNAIARSRGVSHHTVRRHRDVAIANNLTTADIDAMTDTQYRQMFDSRTRSREKTLPKWAEEAEFRAKGHNLIECHARYANGLDNQAALSYSSYCEGMRNYDRSQVVIFRHNHAGGHAMQTDFAGYRPEGLEAKAKRKFELFVAVLPASHRLFGIAVRSQSTSDHIEANIAALEYFGGVPEVVIQDNLKAAVIARPRGGAPVINPAFLAFADYYGMRVEPTRVRRPQDKAAVEVAVKLIQRLLRLRLLSQPLLKLSDINIVLLEIIEQLNSRTMKRGNESRNQRFERIDKPALRSLPADRLQFIELPVERRVQPDHHVGFCRVHYSVPYRLTGKMVSVRSSSTIVEIRFDGQIVAIHPRCHEDGKYVTVDLHRPDDHVAWLGRDFDQWRVSLAPSVCALVDIAIVGSGNQKREHERVIARVRRLTRLYGEERFLKAVAMARATNAFSFRNVANILRYRRDIVFDPQPKVAIPIRATTNVRGSEYFVRDLKRKGAKS